MMQLRAIFYLVLTVFFVVISNSAMGMEVAPHSDRSFETYEEFIRHNPIQISHDADERSILLRGHKEAWIAKMSEIILSGGSPQVPLAAKILQVYDLIHLQKSIHNIRSIHRIFDDQSIRGQLMKTYLMWLNNEELHAPPSLNTKVAFIDALKEAYLEVRNEYLNMNSHSGNCSVYFPDSHQDFLFPQYIGSLSHVVDEFSPHLSIVIKDLHSSSARSIKFEDFQSLDPLQKLELRYRAAIDKMVVCSNTFEKYIQARQKLLNLSEESPFSLSETTFKDICMQSVARRMALANRMDPCPPAEVFPPIPRDSASKPTQHSPSIKHLPGAVSEPHSGR